MDDTVRFSVLGPLRAWRNEKEIDLGPPQQRAVVAALLFCPNGQGSVDQLIGALWAERAPRSAAGVLRTYVSRLRRILGPAGEGGGVIETTNGGYSLSHCEVDLEEFRQAISLARAARRDGAVQKSAALLRDGLSLWSGTPLCGIEAPFAAEQRFVLEELRLATSEDWLDDEVTSGGHLQALAELRELVTRHPLRERARELLMLALYKAGRQAEALDVFQDARRLLGQELGIDPGPGLKDVHQRILKGDRGLLRPGHPPQDRRDIRLAGRPGPADRPDRLPEDRTARPGAFEAGGYGSPLVPPAQLPPGLPVFTGRKTELAVLDSLVGEQRDTRTATIVSIDGMPGVGKTTLAVHWARRTADRFPDGQLYVDLKGFGSSHTLMTSGEALCLLLGALGVPAHHVPEGVDARSGLYRSLLADKRLLVVLDNANDVEQVRPLLPGGQDCCAVITSRNRLGGLVSTEGAHLLPLGLPTMASARKALARRLGGARTDAEPEAVDEIIKGCARLPLALAVVAARATFHQGFPLAAIAAELRAAHGGLEAFSNSTGTDVRAVFSWSYHKLSVPAQRLFRMLALHRSPDISGAAAASLAGMSSKRARTLLAELTGAWLLTEQRPGRYAFHELIRAYAAECGRENDSAVERHEALGRLLDHYLHTSCTAGKLMRVHLDAGIRAAPRPGVTPENPGDHAGARAWFSAERAALASAVKQATEGAYGPVAWQLALNLQVFYQRNGLLEEWAATMRTVLAFTLSGGDLPGQAHVRRSLAGAYHYQGDHDQALAHLDRTMTQYTTLGYTTHIAYVRSNFATVFITQGRYQEAMEQSVQALATYRREGHRQAEAMTMVDMGRCLVHLGDHERSFGLVQEAMAVYREISERHGEGDCWSAFAEIHDHLGRTSEADACRERAIKLYQELGDRADEAADLVLLGDSKYTDGAHETARVAWSSALTILEELHHPLVPRVRTRIRNLDTRREPAVRV